MTTKEILEMSFDDLNKLKFSDLKELTKRLSKTANTRIRTIVDRYEKTPAIQGLIQSGGKFGVGDAKTLNQMRREFARVRNFLMDETTTVWVVEKWKTNSIAQLADKRGIIISRDKFDVIYKTLSDLQDIDEKFEENLMKYTYLEMMEQNFDEYVKMTTEQLHSEVLKYYEQSEKSTSRLFDND